VSRNHRTFSIRPESGVRSDVLAENLGAENLIERSVIMEPVPGTTTPGNTSAVFQVALVIGPSEEGEEVAQLVLC
jgi:hypothetical protein